MDPRPKKRFGQHFLTSAAYAERIAAAVPARTGECVLEIGAGTGALSRHLAQRFERLHCVEKDRDLTAVLHRELTGTAAVIHEADFLRFDLAALNTPLHVVGNLPYSVGALIIHRVLLHEPRVSSCTFMVQREVAERICARPHGRQNGYLSIVCQFFGQPRILFRVPAGAFTPRPSVESAVFRMSLDGKGPDLVVPDQRPSLFALVSLGYSQRRKKLGAVLRRQLGASIPDAFAQACVDPHWRAEDLCVDDWCRLFLAMRVRGLNVSPRSSGGPRNEHHRDMERS